MSPVAAVVEEGWSGQRKNAVPYSNRTFVQPDSTPVPRTASVRTTSGGQDPVATYLAAVKHESVDEKRLYLGNLERHHLDPSSARPQIPSLLIIPSARRVGGTVGESPSSSRNSTYG